MHEHALEAQVQAIQGNTFAGGADLDRPGSDQFIGLVQLEDLHIHGRNLARVDLGQRVRRVFHHHGSGVRWGQAYGLQVDRNRHALGIGQANVAADLLAIDLYQPTLSITPQLQRRLLHGHAHALERPHLEVDAAQCLLGTVAGAVTGIPPGLFLPGVQVQFRQRAAHADALARRQLGIALAQHQVAPPLSRVTDGRGIGEAGQVCISDVVPALFSLQRHTEGTVARVPGSLAEGRRQIDVQRQLQAKRQLT
ncbi:hypothetical protein D3C85_1013980 [compost metagenome]